jgi:hypothetical protein
MEAKNAIISSFLRSVASNPIRLHAVSIEVSFKAHQ